MKYFDIKNFISILAAHANTSTKMALLISSASFLVSACGSNKDSTTSVTKTTINEIGVHEPTTFDHIYAGTTHTCGITKVGKAYCWGWGYQGQLGNGDTSNRDKPSAVSGDLIFISLSLGRTHTCGIAAGGKAHCWGSGSRGQLGNGSTFNKAQPAAVSGDLTFSSLTAGGYHTCGIAMGGKAYCWGWGDSGQLGNAARADSFEPTAVAEDLVFSSLTASNSHTCGVTDDKKAYCWGWGSFGQLGNGSWGNKLRPFSVGNGMTFSSLTANNSHTCGVTVDGKAYCWGMGGKGKLGVDDTSFSNKFWPTAVSGELVFSSLAAGQRHTCGVTVDGKAYCWGSGKFYGQLGNGERSVSSKPTAVSGGLTFSSLTAGGYHTCGIADGSRTYCWGLGHRGQLGSGDRIDRHEPSRVFGW